MNKAIPQMELVSTILRFLDKCGVKEADAGVFNAVIKAADLVVAEVSRERIVAGPGEGLKKWLRSDDTGMSSQCIASNLYHVQTKNGNKAAWPLDPSDFGRCYRLMEAVPGTRERIGEMAKVHPVWAALSAAWPELEALYLEEQPTGNAPKLYARMKEIIGSANGGAQ